MKQGNTINLDIAVKYADDIIKGDINACKYIKQACKIFKDNLERKDLIFNCDEVNQVVKFINTLYLTEQLKPTHFYLQPWQTFIIANIYGFYYIKSGKRKYKYIYIEIPRKNGKSMLINALAIYHLIFEYQSQIIVSANKMEQAKIVNFKQAKIYCEQLDKRQKHLKPQFSKIKCEENHSELIITASDSKTLDGLNVSLGIIDELHEAKNSGMYNIIKSSQGSRINPLLFVITTAGDNVDSFCYSMRSYTLDILSGSKFDDAQFSLIYTLDEGDDYTLETNWYKANPNLDVSVYRDFIESEVTKAINNPVETNGVKVKNFNIWLQNKGEVNRYIDMQFVNKAMQNIHLEDELFNGLDTWCGVDLGAVDDLTSVAYQIQLDDKIYFFLKYYIAEYSLNTNINKQLYKEWAKQGYININEGNATDYKQITQDLVTVSKEHFINQISYDKYNASQWAIDSTEQGLYLMPFSQSNMNMNNPTKELARLIMKGNVIIEYNPITQWMFNNVIIKEQSGNIRPDKSKNSNKIDGVVSMIISLGGYLSSNRAGFNIY